jgi:hypothetical protein
VRPEADRRPAARSERLGLLLAVLLPAVVAGGAVALVAGAREPGVESSRPPSYLAALADQARLAGADATPLRPLTARRGVGALGGERLESIEGGIRPGPPVSISIPAAGVDAPVERVGLRGGALKVPALGTAGWFEAGPRPGEPGRAVVIGHLDTRRGAGLFARVPELPPGTPIALTDRRGVVHRFRVVGAAQVEKDEFPSEHVYGHADSSVLVLVTCGGPYRRGKGYRDNIVLYARAARG